MTSYDTNVRDASKNALISIFDTKDKDWSLYNKTQELLDFINPVEKDFYLDERNVDVFIRALPFYKETNLIKIQSKDPDDIEFLDMFYLKNGEELIYLDGNNEKIYEVNTNNNLNINDENVFDYLKFFAAFIVSEDNQQSFFILENGLSEFLKGESSYNKSRALREYDGAIVKILEEEKRYYIKTRILHCNAIYDSEFIVSSNGTVVMEEDQKVGSL